MIRHNTIRNINLIESNFSFLNKLRKDELNIQYDMILNYENIISNK